MNKLGRSSDLYNPSSTMCSDVQNLGILLFLLSFKIIAINSKASTLWRLNGDKTRIVQASALFPTNYHSHLPKRSFIDDSLFEIIASTEHYGKTWVKLDGHNWCFNCQNNKVNLTTNENLLDIQEDRIDKDDLDCGKPVNFTYYDSLVGVTNRNHHPSVPESQVILYFTKNFGNSMKELEELTIEVLEYRLKKAKREKPKSVQIYNQLGNFWRIKGDAKKAIECFRKALATSPHNAEVLLNLARILFSLQYLDDAIYLTRRSLEVQPADKSAWLQYFTLGEIFKAYGSYQEASIHLRHTLELNPDFEPAQLALKEVEMMPATPIHIYTLVIITCLVMGVLLVILSSVDNTVDYSDDLKHFNRAMAMRSLRGITITTKRCKRSS